MADTVIRIKREEGFTVLPNALLRDQRLSLKTKGLFCMMLSFPGDWSGKRSMVSGAGSPARCIPCIQYPKHRGRKIRPWSRPERPIHH